MYVEENVLVLSVQASANKVYLSKGNKLTKKLINFKIDAGFDVNLISKYCIGVSARQFIKSL